MRFLFLILIFIKPCFSSDWQKVYLASYPRSGNHWTRYLLEEATHIATSSAYCDPDPPHLPNPFKWGGYCVTHGYEGNCRYPVRGEVVVIKTHFPYKKDGRFDWYYSKVICLIRNPIDVFYSYYVYSNKEKSLNTIPRQRLSFMIRTYRAFYEWWSARRDVLMVRYEDLLNDPYAVFRQIMEATGYPFNEEDIKRAVDKFPPEGAPYKHIHHYTEEDLNLIRTELRDVLQKYGYAF